MSDKETQKVLSEGEKWKHFVEGDMWKEVKGMFERYAQTLDSYSSLPEGLSPQAKIEAMERREGAVSLIRQLIQDVEGKAEQYETNKNLNDDEAVDHIARI